MEIVRHFKYECLCTTKEESIRYDGYIHHDSHTDGEPLDYEQIELPELPLIERAEEWGISVKAIPGNYRYLGAYSMNRKEIALATAQEGVFFHELSHAAHEKVIGKLKSGQDPYQEIVAELAAAALCKIVGKQASDTIGNSYMYIESYAKKVNHSPYSACMKVIRETEQVINLILEGDGNEQIETVGEMQAALA